VYQSILLALDGSPDSLAGGQLAIALSQHLGCAVTCVHAYDERIHDTRFREMEPGLPNRYQEPEYLDGLRESHGALMSEGFASLSRGYLEAFLAQAREAGVAAREVVARGRNYVVLVDQLLAGGHDLVILGATGLGAQGDGLLGSTATRVLRRAAGDVFLARAAAPWRGRPLVVGVDGSESALQTARKAIVWARALGGEVELGAAYDPGLHRTVFATMGHSLAPERQAEVGLDRQQQLHEELIDDGLGRLYETFLSGAIAAVRAAGAGSRPNLLQGKAYRALVECAVAKQAGVLAVGRFGHHREAGTDLGSTAEAVARTAPCSVLVVGETDTHVAHPADLDVPAEPTPTLPWDEDALARLERIPSFARPMARRAIEEKARGAGETRVTAAVFARVAQEFGMARPGGDD